LSIYIFINIKNQDLLKNNKNSYKYFNSSNLEPCSSLCGKKKALTSKDFLLRTKTLPALEVLATEKEDDVRVRLRVRDG